MMDSPRTRRVQRVVLAQPLVARLNGAPVLLLDVSILGARVEHPAPLVAGGFTRLTFTWEGAELDIECRIVRSRVEHAASGVYHSGLEFEAMTAATKVIVKEIIGRAIARALDEQKLNARGVLPAHDLERMPLFRPSGQLTASWRLRENGYVCYHLENRQWRRKRTHDPEQPADGFTISAMEERTQVELLCDAYERSDHDGRRMIRLFAQLSISEAM